MSNHLNIVDGTFESASDYHDVTIASGATLELTGDITVSGNWTNNGTFTAGSHTVTFDGSTAQSISGSNSFYNLILSGSVVTLQSDLNILNNLTVSSSSTFDYNSRIVTISGATDINGTLTASTGFFDANGAFDATGGTVQFTATGNLKLGSTVTSLGTFTRGTSKVTYDGSSPQNIYNANYYDLSINNSSGTNLIAGTSLEWKFRFIPRHYKS